MFPIAPKWFEYSFVLKNIVFAVTISSLFNPFFRPERKLCSLLCLCGSDYPFSFRRHGTGSLWIFLFVVIHNFQQVFKKITYPQVVLAAFGMRISYFTQWRVVC